MRPFIPGAKQTGDMQNPLKTDIPETLDLMRHGVPLVDVRTPAEFEKGHIPGAINLPLFSNEERHQVGLTYKQEGREAAVLLGLQLVGPRLAELGNRAGQIAPQRRIVLHCWRGGMRSASVGWLLQQLRYEVFLIDGGYKSFRHWVLARLEEPRTLLILSGATGTGKTDILQELGHLGESVIDLEALAHHKGSAFGALGEEPEPTQEHFENLLGKSLAGIPTAQRLWLEDESRRIGRRNIPQPFWLQMRAAPVICLDLSREHRRDRLVEDYGHFATTDLLEAINTLKKRLGGQRHKEVAEALVSGDLESCITLLLEHYYDPAYRYGLGRRESEIVVEMPCDSPDPAENARIALKGLERLQEIIP